MDTHRYPSERAKLLAFHYLQGSSEPTTTNSIRLGDLVYEVTEDFEDDGSRIYEGWIFNAHTKQMLLKRPYQADWAGAFATWWEKETGTTAPEELLSRRGYSRD